MIRKPTLYSSLVLALSLAACSGAPSTITPIAASQATQERVPQACVCGPGSIIVSETFTPNSFSGGAGGNSHLVITLTAVGQSYYGVGFTDTLPTYLMTVAGRTTAWTNTCNGTASTVPDSSTFSLSNGKIAAGTSCQVSFIITGHIPGTYWNVIPANAIHALGNPTSNSATAAVTVTQFNVYPGA